MSVLTLTLRQPAQLGDRPQDDFVLATMKHLPGTAVRGAFAAAWIARHGAPEPGNPRRTEFLRLFEGGVRFGALLRPGTEFASLAVARHKYDPNPDCQIVAHDQARGDDPPPQCPDCGSPLETRAGITGEAPKTRRRTSVAIGDNDVAIRGALFTRETLNAGQSFTGTLIAGDPGDLPLLARLAPVRVGGRRTTHGLADASITDGEIPGLEPLGEQTFVIRLRSPGIFTDPCGRPAREPSDEELSDILQVPARVRRSWTRWQEVGGWHIASGLPKPSELAVLAGSTFIIETERAPGLRAVEALARRGVGLRRHEGFGDLAPPPVLQEGLLARKEGERHLRAVMDTVAPLKGVPVRWPERWPALRNALAGFARGEAAAARHLHQEAGNASDAGIASALQALLAMPAADARYAAGELSKL
jgi:CRISPR-associated protein Csx10